MLAKWRRNLVILLLGVVLCIAGLRFFACNEAQRKGETIITVNVSDSAMEVTITGEGRPPCRIKIPVKVAPPADM